MLASHQEVFCKSRKIEKALELVQISCLQRQPKSLCSRGGIKWSSTRPVHAGSEWFLLSCLCSFSLHYPCRCRSMHWAWHCLSDGSETASIHYLDFSVWHVQFLWNTLTWISGNFCGLRSPQEDSPCRESTHTSINLAGVASSPTPCFLP